jgi:alpha-tubulin suppressor-like RCC1 family protein
MPTLVPLDGVTAIGLASFSTCAARADGVYCWGANVNGLVGNGTAGSDVTTPTPSLVTCP